METATQQGSLGWFDVGLLRRGDHYIDDGYSYRVLFTSKVGWNVTIYRDDHMWKRYNMNRKVEVVELAP